MNSDFKEMLQALNNGGVKYLVVGGWAVGHHSQPRHTKDLEIWIKPDAENANRLMNAFSEFGMMLVDIEECDFAKEGTQYFVGVPPVALDFLTTIEPLDFDASWEQRDIGQMNEVKVNYIGKSDLIESKKAADRDTDRADIRSLTLLSEDE